MISKSLEKKIARKQKRCQQIISNEIQIVFTEELTRNLCICNAGLSTGLRNEAIIDEIQKYSKSSRIEEILMIPGKSYCFVVFPVVADSSNVYNEMHGTSRLGQNKGVVYLSFVENVPIVRNPWNTNPPDGLIVLEDFITEQEEAEIISGLDWKTDDEKEDEGRTLKYRQVKHFGYEFIYGSNNIDRNQPLSRKIPQSCDILWPRLENHHPELGWHFPDQMTANKYEPGQGIPPHVDTHSAFEDPILSLSLSGNTVMEFRGQGDRHSFVYLKRRSLLIMSGESRFGWTHGITPRMTDIVDLGNGLTSVPRSLRISLTFRKLRDEPSLCDCKFTALCDTFQNKTATKSELSAAQLELENVHNVYNEIGNHFSETRHSPWPKVENFINKFDIGAILCDIGCGNGKYLKTNEQVFKIGCDRSDSLLNVCREREFNIFLSDCLALPIKSESIDGCISIAVIHHLASFERRLKAVLEMARILVSGGRGLIYVWAKNQKADNKKSSYLRQNKKNNKSDLDENVENDTPPADVEIKNNLPVHTNRTEFKHQDILVPWKLKENQEENEKKVFLRYYHVFEENELDKMCLQVDGIQVVESYYDQGNWCVILKKN